MRANRAAILMHIKDARCPPVFTEANQVAQTQVTGPAPASERKALPMSHTPHELAQDFPELTDKIRELQQSDTHFSRLADEYHEVNRAVHRAETNVEPTSDAHLTDLRKSRMALKDEIYKYMMAS